MDKLRNHNKTKQGLGQGVSIDLEQWNSITDRFQALVSNTDAEHEYMGPESLLRAFGTE